LNNYARVRGAI